jgi:hypothetical protein
MPTVALIGPELYPIPPIRGGAVELFIEKVADRLTNWRPVVIGVRPGTAPQTRGRRVPHSPEAAWWLLPLPGVTL